MNLLEGKTALVFGVANDHSIAWGIARTMHAHGARLGFSYANEALERRVRPLAHSVGATFVEPCDVSKDDDIDALFAKAKALRCPVLVFRGGMSKRFPAAAERPFLEGRLREVDGRRRVVD